MERSLHALQQQHSTSRCVPTASRKAKNLKRRVAQRNRLRVLHTSRTHTHTCVYMHIIYLYADYISINLSCQRQRFRSGPLEGWGAKEGVSSIGLPLAFFGFLRKGLPEKRKIRGCLLKDKSCKFMKEGSQKGPTWRPEGAKSEPTGDPNASKININQHKST